MSILLYVAGGGLCCDVVCAFELILGSIHESFGLFRMLTYLTLLNRGFFLFIL